VLDAAPHALWGPLDRPRTLLCRRSELRLIYASKVVRIWAAAAVARIGPGAADLVPVLVGALADKDVDVYAAPAALTWSGGTSQE
jgi:hypothetical protein